MRFVGADDCVAFCDRGCGILALDVMTRFLKELHHLWVFVGVAPRGGEPDCCGGNQREKLSCDEAHRSNENKMSDGGRGCTSLAVNVWKSSQMWTHSGPPVAPS